MYGLTDKEISLIKEAISRFPEIKEAKIFGSRARGDYTNSSDIDIALIGDDITIDTVSKLHSILEEDLPLPYYFDIVNYSSLDNFEFKKEIDSNSVGVILI